MAVQIKFQKKVFGNAKSFSALSKSEQVIFLMAQSYKWWNNKNHLINNGLISRIHENYAEIHGLPSPGRNVNRITQSLIFLPAINQFIATFLQTHLAKTKLAEEQRKLVDENYLVKRGETAFRARDSLSNKKQLELVESQKAIELNI
ncbi:4527_t:CDS:2 [Diversispora eburnea]|uniref:4527_t:CDS:1 n=1 Tax=Diversispora eburnea TaxID=1213867 RepID=A0A9N8WPC7_9GLOM|nr:4527_t:CDS:2 [Diversispora eburnea]